MHNSAPSQGFHLRNSWI